MKLIEKLYTLGFLTRPLNKEHEGLGLQELQGLGYITHRITEDYVNDLYKLRESELVSGEVKTIESSCGCDAPKADKPVEKVEEHSTATEQPIEVPEEHSTVEEQPVPASDPAPEEHPTVEEQPMPEVAEEHYTAERNGDGVEISIEKDTPTATPANEEKPKKPKRYLTD